MMTITVPDSQTTICRLGFGCARMGGSTNAWLDRRLLESARSIGITHFDTAPSYGSEGVLGEVLGSDLDVTITTKVGIPRAESRGKFRSRLFVTAYRATVRPALSRAPWLKRRFLRSLVRQPVEFGPMAAVKLTKPALLQDLERSLKLLKRSRIDLYLLHEPEYVEMTEEIPEVLAQLKQEGIIGAFGTAFGGSCRDDLAVGSVEQCRYDSMDREASKAGTMRIYHGVLRNRVGESAENGRSRGRASAGEMLSKALVSKPGCAVIFSASSSHQVRQMEQVFKLVASAADPRPGCKWPR